jgi:uncharacterized protein YeaO (DUF488 family)
VTPALRVKRAYRPAEPSDGQRILVDRLWPRGVARDALRAEWMKELAPSAALRRWFGHDPAKWDEFRARYAGELDSRPDAVARLRARLADGPATLLFAAKDETYNNAVALRDYLLRGA